MERPRPGVTAFCEESKRHDQQLSNGHSRKALSRLWGPHPEEPRLRQNDMFELQEAVLLALPGRVRGAQTWWTSVQNGAKHKKGLSLPSGNSALYCHTWADFPSPVSPHHSKLCLAAELARTDICYKRGYTYGHNVYDTCDCILYWLCCIELNESICLIQKPNWVVEQSNWCLKVK